MIKNNKLSIFLIIAVVLSLCLTAGSLVCLVVSLKTDKREIDIRDRQAQLKDSLTFPTRPKVLEEISLDIDLAARGDVYADCWVNLESEVYHADKDKYFLVKLAEFLPADDKAFVYDGPARDWEYTAPEEYIALYMYGNKDEYNHMHYALQWGSTVVKLGDQDWYLERDHMEVVRGRDYIDSETVRWTDMLVKRSYESGGGFCVYVKEDGVITEYKLWEGEYAQEWGFDPNIDYSQLYFTEVLGNQLTIYTHNTALSVTAKPTLEWDDKNFNLGRYSDSNFSLKFSVAAYRVYDDGEPVSLSPSTVMAGIYGNLYLDRNRNEFILKDIHIEEAYGWYDWDAMNRIN